MLKQCYIVVIVAIVDHGQKNNLKHCSIAKVTVTYKSVTNCVLCHLQAAHSNLPDMCLHTSENSSWTVPNSGGQQQILFQTFVLHTYNLIEH